VQAADARFSPPQPGEESEIAVVARGVSKRYGATLALASLDLDIRSGEIFGLLGPNGSGKTTFIRLLSGYLLPTDGRLEICGHNAVEQPQEARRLIGYVPEAAPVYGYMRVREFLVFMARLRGMTGRAVADAVDRVIAALALDAVADRPARTLSRGYRQRTAIAQALVHDPKLLILDEPANGLDPRQIIEIRSLIRGLAGRHTVLMSSHVLSEVARMADRVGVLLDGRLKGIRDMADTPDLEAWFLSLA
jgi:ABC-2 type transport system ATP-binding protein